MEICKNLTKINFLIAALLAIATISQAQINQTDNTETQAQRDARMAWWREARFGMFIHWGVYAVPAGTYHGEQIKGLGEWIMHNAKIPVVEYKAYAKEFNPVKYDPQAWAKLAKEAGMRYVIITSKHHEGFALFPSKASTWNVFDATPYGKDLIAPLARAVRAEGLHFGLYYSQAQDWVNPGGAKSGYDEPNGWDEAQKGSFDDYLKNVAAPQVTEILTRYQPDVIWWDTPRWMTKERADVLLPLLKLRPGIIQNNRLGFYNGDTETPEQFIPATGFKDRDWEVCMTMNGTWGYKSYDNDWKSTEDLLKKLCDIVSKGGNFLLNVGPNAQGEIPQPSIDRLKAIGAWMKINSESIYGTTANPLAKMKWGRCTKKIDRNKATLYLHVFEWPSDGKLMVPGLKNKPVKVSLLDGGSSLKFQPTENGLVIEVPEKAPDKIVSVIKLKIDGQINADPVALMQSENGNVDLTDEEMADIQIDGNHGRPARIQTLDGQDCFSQWTDYRCWIGWNFKIKKPGAFEVVAEVGSKEPSTLVVGITNGENHTVNVEPKNGSDEFRKISLGTVTIPKAGVYELRISPENQNSWKQVNLRNVELLFK